jgi:probable rRNA maturation factor
MRSVIVSSNGVRMPVAGARLAALAAAVLRAERVAHAEVSMTCLTPRQMARLNRQHLGHTGPTDVITFALGRRADGVLEADIYLCPAVARAQAKGHGVGIREELARLAVHATLHACGWDHPEDAGRTASPMWRRQERYLQRYWTTSVRAA